MSRALNLAVIGLGNRAAGLLSTLQRVCPDVRVAAAADPNPDSSRRRLRQRGLADDIRVYASADELLEHADGFDGILIASPCDLHTPLAIKAAPTGLPLFLEKPVAVSYDQVLSLRDAYRGREGSVLVSFPMRLTPLFMSVMEVVRSGRLGVINQVQAINNVPYGGIYYASPSYREYGVTRGQWLQEAIHNFDYLNVILGRPLMVTAMMSRKVFGGDMPHDLHCSSCDRAETCPESPQGVARRGDDGGVGTGDHPCVFGDGIRHQDAGSAIIHYEGGVHASFTQNYVSRRSAGLLATTITGYEATLSFDWMAETARIVEHHSDRVDRIGIGTSGGHQGGDDALARNFVEMMLGRGQSRSDLSAGLGASALCLAARASAHAQAWMPVGDVFSDGFPCEPALAGLTPADVEPVVSERTAE